MSRNHTGSNRARKVLRHGPACADLWGQPFAMHSVVSYTSENDPHGQNFPEDLSLRLCHASCLQKSKCKLSELLPCSSANQQDLAAISSWKMMTSQCWSPAVMAGRATAHSYPRECCPWHPHPNAVSLMSTLTGGGFQRHCPSHTPHTSYRLKYMGVSFPCHKPLGSLAVLPKLVRQGQVLTGSPYSWYSWVATWGKVDGTPRLVLGCWEDSKYVVPQVKLF